MPFEMTNNLLVLTKPWNFLVMNKSSKEEIAENFTADNLDKFLGCLYTGRCIQGFCRHTKTTSPIKIASKWLQRWETDKQSIKI